ncbi:ABC transporter permease [Terricaulis silvestris]|uniref:Gliding motility-associated ABC transporter permease protein GldF n=1 Tax=Terricaulis silvestris TaxID=2686094 RepID=A0A6I6MUP4_9CAUL|nr:ABC transporter permease [Terricaulis silvestris]QGZ95382.1 gliding motility-associated ABC transporter permease protein GldF [Terricaulis silvestris]
MKKRPGLASMTAIYRRELLAYLTTPTAYVFVAVFLFAIGLFTFQVGGFFEARRADLNAFFAFHPWIFMVFLPAVSMRLWAEETRSGAVELLMTLPAPTWSLVLGKFLAAWTIAAVALLLTIPLWITVNVLGSPDNAAIFTAYLASLLMAGAYIAIGSAMSALTPAQVVAFVLAVLISFLLTALGLPLVLDFFSGVVGGAVAETVARFSIMHHFDAAQRGVVEFRSIFYFVSLISLCLGFTALAVDARRGG